MGIQGLLPLLKSIQKPTHLRNFAGQTIGVDAYGWLHRGTISCAVELAEGKPTRKHIDFAVHKVRMLIHFGVKPYLVFDGDYLPSKTHTEKGRAARRRDSKKLGLELLRMGRSSQAQLELQKAIDVTPTMARELIEELKKLGVKYTVAPYEADSQLAYLEKRGIISGVLSEDSDLLVFGVKCLLTKLDQYGECIMINREHFTACREVSLVGWSDKEFRLMAMLSGCDYLPGIGGMGLKTAWRLVRKHKTVDRIIRTVQLEGKMKVPSGYMDAFNDAERTFLYQWVFCPENLCLKNLVELPADLKAEDMPFLGQHVEPQVAAGVACGDLDPNTKKPILLPNRFQPPLRRASTIQTPNEKKGKPISEYFRANRIPLAELDVNSFTPSPSQQRLLETQGNVSWSASHVSGAQTSLIDRFNRIQAPASAPQALRRTVSTPCAVNRRASPKRQRLCSDAFTNEEIGTDAEDCEASTTSRFFNNQSTQASPSLRKKPNDTQREDFQLWSDDSIAEAMVAASSGLESTNAHSTSSPRKRKKLGVFADSSSPGDSQGNDDTSQLSVTSSHWGNSQSQTSHLTPSTSFDSLSTASQSILSQGIAPNFNMLKSHSLTNAAHHSAPGTKTFDERPEDAQVPQSSHTGLLDKFALQEVAKKKDDVVQQMLPEHADSEKREPDQPAQRVSKDEVQLSHIACSATLDISSNTKGSEDLLVPNSPDLLDDDCSAKSKLMLGKFAFAG